MRNQITENVIFLTKVRSPIGKAAARLLIESIHPGMATDVQIHQPLRAWLETRLATS